MYDRLYKINRVFSYIAALLVLLGLVITPMGETIGLNTMAGIVIWVTAICGAVLIDRKLEKIVIAESWKAALAVDLEEATDQLYQEEKTRRRKEGKPL